MLNTRYIFAQMAVPELWWSHIDDDELTPREVYFLLVEKHGIQAPGINDGEIFVEAVRAANR